MTTIEHKDGYTIIDRRQPEPCRVCACPTECHSTQYGKPTMKCIEYLRGESRHAEALAGIPDPAAFVSAADALVAHAREAYHEIVPDVSAAEIRRGLRDAIAAYDKARGA